MIYLHKIFPLLISPLAISLMILVVAILLRSRRIGVGGILILVFFSSPFVAAQLTKFIEKDNPPVTIESIADADAIIVLSGMLHHSFINGTSNYDFRNATDRLFAGIKLAEAGKAPELIFTRGKLPWSTGRPEGEILAEKAAEFGIDRARISLSPAAQNTEQEAAGLSRQLDRQKQNIILVTSAFHMPRAYDIFTAYGFAVTAFPVDHRTSSKTITAQDFIPQAGALYSSSKAIRELIGRAYYALKLAM